MARGVNGYDSRVSTLDASGPNGDLGSAPVVAPAGLGVAQNIEQRLHLRRGEWVRNVADGVPYFSQVLGKFTPNRDAVIRAEVLQVQDVTRCIVVSEVRNEPRPRVLEVLIYYSTIHDEDPEPLTLALEAA